MEFTETPGGSFEIVDNPTIEQPPISIAEKPEGAATQGTDETPVKEEPIVQEPPVQENKPDFGALIGEATKGAVKTPEEFEQAWLRFQQLEQDSQKPKYKSPQEEKIAQFLLEYPGQDYGTSFQVYLKLQSIDVKSLDATAAIKESMVLDSIKLGMSPAKAEQLADKEIEKKYADEDDDLLKERDSIQAKQRLETLQQESKAPTANPQQEAVRQQQAAVKEKAEKVRTDYLSKTQEIFKKGYESVKIKVSDNDAEDLVLKPYDAKDDKGERIYPIDLKNLVEDYDQKVVVGRYGIKDDKGELVGFNPSLVSQDLEKIYSFEQRIKEAVQHGITIGKLRHIKEQANIGNAATKTNNAKASTTKGGTFEIVK